MESSRSLRVDSVQDTGCYEQSPSKSSGYGSQTGSLEESSQGYGSPTDSQEESSQGYGSELYVLEETSEDYEAIVEAFRQCEEADGKTHRMQVAMAVSIYRPTGIVLKKPRGSVWKIGHLDDTMYKKKKNVVEEWGDFYLPDEVTMEVMGVVEHVPCPRGQLVLMTCEDKKLYAYDGEELHEVASSMKELFDKGIQYPGSKRFYNGEAFKDMTEKDWAEVRQSDVGKKLEEEHRKLVTKHKSTFMKCLDVI